MKRRMLLENWKLYGIVGIIIVMMAAIITIPILMNTKSSELGVCCTNEEGFTMIPG